MRHCLSILTAAFLLGAPSAFADQVTLAPLADNTLFEDADGDTSNGSGPALFAGMNNQGGGRARRALIVFDVASRVPPGAVIESVTLGLNVSNTSDPLPRAMTVHRVSSEWGEGQSIASGGSGAQAAQGDASWTHASYPDRLWREPGGDFEAVPSASGVVGGMGPHAWTGSGLVADVRAWLDQSATNFGWLVLGIESEPGTARRFDSREHPNTANHPFLIIHYSLPKPARMATWGSIKAAYR